METGGEGVAKVVSVSEAVRQIHSGDTVAISGSGGCVCEPTGILKALGVRYLEEQQPRDLTILHAGGPGKAGHRRALGDGAPDGRAGPGGKGGGI